MIYFIKSPEGPIKIGTTIRLSERLKTLTREYGQDLEVIAVTDGSYQIESELHARFAHLNVVNEWFRPGDDLLGFIASDARPWDGKDERPFKLIQISKEALRFSRMACGFTEESLSDYVTRVVRDRAQKDLDTFLDEYMASREGAREKAGAATLLDS